MGITLIVDWKRKKMPKLNEIEGIIPGKKDTDYITQSQPSSYIKSHDEGFNSAIDLMAKRRVELEWDKDEIIKIIITHGSLIKQGKLSHGIYGYLIDENKLAELIIAACPVKIKYVEEGK